MAKNIIITPGTGVFELVGDTSNVATSKATWQIDTHGNLTWTPASVSGVRYIAGMGIATGIINQTANQITVVHGGVNGQITFSLPNTVIFPGIAQVSTAPVSANDLTNKAYVDGIVPTKAIVRATTTANITISNPGTIMFDGVNFSNGQRLMLQGQTDPTENGIYVFNGSAVALTRAADFNTWTQIPQSIIPVQAGSTYANTLWMTSVQPGGTIGSTAITFKRIDSPFVVPSAGMVSSNGSVLSTRLIVNADINDVAWNKITGVPGSITSITDPVVNNGLYYTGTTFVLGQTLDLAGNPAKILQDRQIPLNTFNLYLTPSGSSKVIVGPSGSIVGSSVLQVTGSIRSTGLAGTGTRKVVADTNGNLLPSDGSDSFVDITYSAIAALATAETLIVGQYYRITDYRAIYKQRFSNVTMGDTGSLVESTIIPLIVRAITPAGIDHVAIVQPAVGYPNADKWTVHYDLNLPVSITYTYIDWSSVTGPEFTQLKADVDAFFTLTTSALSNPAFITYIDGGQFLIDTGQVEERWEIHAQLIGLYSGGGSLPTTNTPTDVYNTVYAWAVPTSRGVIYRMIDEFRNDLPYDFKNITYRRYESQAYTDYQTWINTQFYELSTGANANSGSFINAYTFNLDQTGPSDLSSSIVSPGTVTDNVIVPNLAAGVKVLNNVVAYGATVNNDFTNLESTTFGAGTLQNKIDLFGTNMKFSSNFNNNVFGKSCSDVTASDNFASNVIGDNCQTNQFGTDVSNNEIAGFFENNFFGNSSQFNTILGGANSSVFGNDFYGNFIEGSFGNNQVGNSASANRFGINCSNNTFGTSMISNSIGATFQNSTIGNAFQKNSVGDNCTNNVIGNGFQNNKVGESLTGASFGDGVQYSTFGNGVQALTLPASALMNNFCSNITTLNLTTGTHILDNKTCDIIIDETSTPVLVYMASNGTFQVVDPTT